ncbi:MAG TPA: hypothetical protein VNO86_03970 [Candidatus Binatia bacterium]|nr:hypothetical protein [Candidatus Binatia bacterium]
MPASQIASNLAFVNWTVLAGLAVGTLASVVLLRRRSSATRGYLSFAAACAAAFGLLAWLADGALPATIVGSPVAVDPAWATPRRLALGALVVLAAATAIAVARGHPLGRLGPLGVGVGIVVLVAAALGWGGSPLGVVLLAVELGLLAAATGGVFAAMVLAHWYLVTPRLPEGPLVLLARGLVAVVAAQLGLFVLAAGLGLGAPGGAAAAGFGVLVGPWAFFVWLRLLVGLVFSLVLVWAALQTARTRSMESATGLLYIGVGTIAAGTILAAGCYFGGGLIV